MALFFPGKTACILCGQVILRSEDAIGFPAFLPKQHRLQRFSDSVFHIRCYQAWPEKTDFEQIYRKYLEIWDSRPRNLDSLKDIEDWGRDAFKDFGLSEDSNDKQKD